MSTSSPARSIGQGAAPSSLDETVKIYTDWANHYLEKAGRTRRFISDLQQDVTDGVLLADVIEAVTNEKLQDIKTKPKNNTQMIENINTCLTFLVNLGVNIEGITAKDIRDGNLKAILGLFFSLSRHKQQQKSQQQQQKTQQQQQRHLAGETTENHTGKGGNSAEDNQSRLPSYNSRPQGSKCPTISHPASKDTGQGRSKGQGQGTKIKQPSQLPNGQPAQSGVDVNSISDPGSSAQRATSPPSTGIPIPGGRGLPARSQSATPDKAQNRNAQCSTPTPNSQQKSGIPGSKQNSSMLEKFKLFHTKEKPKAKSAGKSSSKGGSTGTSSASTSTLSTSSRSDTSSSISARSSSSADAGPSSSATSTNDPDSPKFSKARPVVGGTSSSKRENPGSLTIGQQQSRQASPSHYSSSLPATPVSSLPVSAHGKKLSGKSQRSADGQHHRFQQGSQTLGKPSKGGSLIPKSGKSQKSSSTLSLTSSSSGSQIPSYSGATLPAGSSIPTPGSAIPTSNNSIPKSSQSSSKLSKGGREEKMRGTGSSKDSQPSQTPTQTGIPQANGQTQGMTSLPRKSKSSHASSSQQQQIMQQQQQILQQQQLQQQLQLHQQQQQQQQKSTSNPPTTSAPPVPPHRNGSQISTNSLTRQQAKHTPSSSQSQGPKSPQDNSTSTSSKPRYTEIEYTDGKVECVGEGHFVKPNNQAQTAISNQSGNVSHSYLISSQSVNVVKPTCSSPSVSRSDQAVQPNVPIMHNRSAQPPPLPKTEPPPSTRTTVNNQQNIAQSTNAMKATNQVAANNQQPTNQLPSSPNLLTPKSQAQESPDNTHSTSSSSNDSVIINTSATNSPRLGIKLGSQTNQRANNVAIVQPHHGEKKETTFDKDVRTDVINKDNKDNDLKDINKDTDKKTTFIADSGETLDIKPMEPINRSMHYAQGYMRSPYASPGKPIPIAMAQNQCYAMTGITPNRMGLNRSLMEANKFYSGSIKRTISSGSGNVSYDEYSSDYDTYDYISGYMSDGDILKGNRGDDMSSGYMSEGGASLYARRLQQRFREGMQAVKECMQKNNNLGDEDSFDDSSSISSDDISDTINEISTDEGNLQTGSNQDQNPYAAGKRAGPKDLFRNLTNANLHATPGKRVPNLGTSAFLGTDYMSDVPKPSDHPQQVGFRKFSLQNNRLLSSDPADYAYLYNGYDQWRSGQMPNAHPGPFNQEANVGHLRKLSQPDIQFRSQSSTGDYASSDKTYPNTKCDSETNTDQSHVYESNVRKMQNMRGLQPGGVGYGFNRRPLSNTSTGSVGSTKSAPGGHMGSPVGSPAKGNSNTVGSRLAKHGLDQIAQQYHAATSRQRQEQSIAAQHQKTGQQQDGGKHVPEFSSASLERRTKSSSAAQTEMEIFKSNSLGRRKGGIGSQMAQNVDNGSMASTIISNPHATYSRPDGSRHNSPYSSVHIPGPAFTVGGNYVPLEFAMGSPRNSAATGGWIRTNSGAVTADGRNIYHHVSDSESMDALSSASSINARIQQARALSSANARILAQSSTYGLQRSNSMKSTRSDSAYASAQQLQQGMPHQHSEGELPSPPPPTSPTPSNSSHASSRFTFPMSSYAASHAHGQGQPMVRSNTSSSLPYGTPLAMTKANRGEDDQDSLHGSSLSLVSSSSSVYSTAEEKQQAEIRKLRRELEVAYDKVTTLSTQLNTNHPYANVSFGGGKYQKKSQIPAHVVAAFEQSLSNMTHRLQHLTSTSEQKDSELNELRATIEALKRQSGLSIQEPLNNVSAGGGTQGRRHTTQGMLGRDVGSHHPSHGDSGTRIQRQISSDSMSSINSMSSACSFSSQQSAVTDIEAAKRKKKKGWLRSSFSKAFNTKRKGRTGSLSDNEQDTNSLRSTLSVPNSPLLQVHMQNGHPLIKGSHSSGAVAGSVPGTPCSQTPLHTPCPTPPRTPVVSRRNSKRESVRSMESRSRSNSPAQEENKAKRRSGYRSRSGRRTPSDAQDDNRPLEFLSSRPSHAIQTPFAQYMVTSQNASAPNTSVVAMVTGSSFIPTVAMTTTVNLVKVASITTTGPSESSYVPMTTESAFSPTVGMTTTSNMMQGSSMATRVFNATYNSMKSEQPLDNNINDPLVASFVESLISAMQPHSQLPKLNTMLTTDSANISQLRLSLPIRSPVQAPSSSQMFIPETQRNTTTLQDSFLSQTSMSSATPHRGENHKQAFVPLNRPVVIKEGILTPVFTSASNNTNMSQNLSSSSLMAMDTTSINSLLSVQNCVTSHSPMVQCSEADPLLCGASNMDLTMAGGASVNGATKPESAFMEFLNNEEDSLMNMLKVDVLDVNSVLSFFTDS